jgi:hypothetical protein
LTIKFTRHTAACSRRDEQLFNCHPERSRGTCFPFGKQTLSKPPHAAQTLWA